jgi:hypothetical protein
LSRTVIEEGFEVPALADVEGVGNVGIENGKALRAVVG